MTTREKEMFKASVEYCNTTEPLLTKSAEYSFIKGAQWADKNPKYPWISVKDDLPWKHKEMVYINPLDRFDQRTSWCIVSDGRFISMDRMYNFTTYEWRWEQNYVM